MQTSILSLVLVLGAFQVVAQYTNQSAPFNLVLCSSNATLNGALLGACHEGAAIEGLCPSIGGNASASYNQFNFNYTSKQTPDPVFGITGLLTWELRGGNFNLSSPMSISTSLTSNVAVPLFTPGTQFTLIGFDNDNMLFIPQYYDDTVVPPKFGSKLLQRWYACTTQDTYLYTTLAWVIGTQPPENPSCQKVEVKRVFV
ncbi:hypothetical protein BGZ57DRAFT_915978 [Hyaloscypha finlandica]|nr:hypothetical protein BGZ57DRAFT_915978 [Hyaloscypha finlandica]